MTSPFVAASEHGAFEPEVQVGAHVERGQRVGWLRLSQHCALLPVLAPGEGRVTWLRSPQLPSVAPGAMIAVLDEEPSLLERARLEEAREVAALAASVEAQAARLARTSGVARELLAADLAADRERLRALRSG